MNKRAAELRPRGRACEAGREILAAVLLGIVVAFWTWQFVEHLAK